MICMACGKDGIGEVCNACIRVETVKMSKDWVYKEGLFGKKTEDFKVVVSNLRVSGKFAIGDNTSGTNVRMDSASHYIKNAKGIVSATYNKKECPAIAIENPNTGMKRFLLMPMYDGNVADLEKAIKECQG